MKRSARLLGAALSFVALTGFQAGFAPGFRSGFQFLGGATANVNWTPTNLQVACSCVMAWFDPSQGVALSGSNVTSWTDRIVGNVVSQATTSKEPVFSATARNSKPGLTFASASSQVLQGTQPTGFPTGTATVVMIAAGYLNGANIWAGIIGYGASTTQAKILGYNASNEPVSGGTYSNNLNSSTYTWNATDRYVEYDGIPGAQALNVDGTLNTATNTSSNNVSTGGSLYIGADAQLEYWNGVVQNIVVLNAALSTANRQKLEGWESWVDGKAGANLPSGHPYKSRPPYTSDP